MFKGKRVLIVDDDVEYQNEVASYLVQRGLFVFPKANKAQFIQSLNDDRPDIVLVDKNLDGEDGFDLFTRLGIINLCIRYRSLLWQVMLT